MSNKRNEQEHVYEDDQIDNEPELDIETSQVDEKPKASTAPNFWCKYKWLILLVILCLILIWLFMNNQSKASKKIGVMSPQIPENALNVPEAIYSPLKAIFGRGTY